MDALNTDLLSNIGVGRAKNADGARNNSAEDLGVNDFLALMLAQIKNQDPFDPKDNGEFISQMAEFGTVSGIGDLNKAFSELSGSLYSNQSLQAASMIGRTVEVPSKNIQHAAGGTHAGSIELPISSNSVRVTIFDGAGGFVRNIDLGMQSSGMVEFNWDGNDQNGSPVPTGQYSVTAEALIGGESQALNTFTGQTVNSVALSGPGGAIQLELANGESVSLGQIRQIQ